ncbi:MAG: trypsin-like peptidase domain-containing protein [Phycisphaerae bacterium]|nr:trypsin-like peptidase domain-containing protein [Phycisphaerae bacterium]
MRQRCRGEWLLVLRAPGQIEPVPDAVVDAARRFTVAVRAHGEMAPTLVDTDGATAGATGHSVDFNSEGSGIVIDQRGLVLTNAHVIADARRIEIQVAGVGWMPARVVGADPQTDLVVLGVDRALPAAASLGDVATVDAGRPVAALGYAPEQLQRGAATVLRGHVRLRRQSLQAALDPSGQQFYAALLESTVPNPQGYSGGPLIDADGRVIGISTAAAFDAQSGQRLGYAIPLSGQTRSIIERLARGENVSHGFLGLLVRASDRSAGEAGGVLAAKVIRGGPAAAAGIRAGDRIMAIGGVDVQDASHLAEIVHHTPADTPLTINLARQGRRLSVIAVLRARSGAGASAGQAGG